MNAPYGETQCQNRVEPHTELEILPHGEGQCFTQHERNPHTELKVQALHAETHCVLRNKEAQIQDSFVSRRMPRDKAVRNERHKEGLYRCYLGTLWTDVCPLHHRVAEEDHDCGRDGYNNPDVQFILDALVGSLATSDAEENLLLKDQSFNSLRKYMSDRESHEPILVGNT